MNEKTIEGILDISMISCPNNCKQGICIVYENTVDEGTVLCPVCGGSGRIDYTNEMKAQEIKELIKEKLPKEKNGMDDQQANFLYGNNIAVFIAGHSEALSDVVKIVEEL